jgi:IclR family transcriptional regulator, KDG regulon repressor
LTETLKNIKLKKFTANTILEKETFRKHLDRVRQDGFAIDEEEIEEGLCCIAAPIKNHSGQVIAGISVSGPSTRLRAHIEGNLKTNVIDKAIQISRRIGFMG